jgi:hypothetical protein
MADTDYYRGGNSLTPKRRELRFDPVTGDVLPERGVSVSGSPANLDRFGGAHRVRNQPPELQIVQVGRDPNHYEIVPTRAMPYAEYVEALGKIQLEPV